MFIRKLYYIAEVMRQQWYKPYQLEVLQQKRVRFTINHAYRNIRYYKELFKSIRLKPSDIRKLKDLKKIPILEREEIIKNFPHNIVARGYSKRNCAVKDSSGSSGIPLITYTDKKSYDYIEMVYARAFFEQGVKPWDRLAYFWYMPFEKRGFWEYLGLMKKNLILFTDDEKSQIKQLLKLKPTVIYCFPSTLYLIAKKINEKKIKGVNPRLIITHGETLFKKTREFFLDTFNCDVFDQYGTSEFTRMAWECDRHNGLHMDIDSIAYEFVKDGEWVGPGEKGELIITSLWNLAMPLIRYRMGDIGVYDDQLCRCGRGLPMLKSIEGRKDDFLLMPSGRVVSPRQLLDRIQADENFNNEEFNRCIYKYKIIQNSVSRITVKIVPKNELSDDFKQKIIDRMNEVLKEDVSIKIKLVKDLPKNPHGKIKIVESKIKNKFF